VSASSCTVKQCHRKRALYFSSGKTGQRWPERHLELLRARPDAWRMAAAVLMYCVLLVSARCDFKRASSTRLVRARDGDLFPARVRCARTRPRPNLPIHAPPAKRWASSPAPSPVAATTCGGAWWLLPCCFWPHPDMCAAFWRRGLAVARQPTRARAATSPCRYEASSVLGKPCDSFGV